MTIGVLKIGVGNTASLMFALERLGAKAVLTDDATILQQADRLILPGVGAAAHAMAALEKKRLAPLLRGFTRPLLGVCLGQQLLYEHSEEGDAKGLGLIAGKVTKLAASGAAPAPHMGWSRLARVRDDPLTDGVAEGAYVYFVHSYVCADGPATVMRASYGDAIPAIVQRSNVHGCQFHPERSGAVGARILANFLALPC